MTQSGHAKVSRVSTEKNAQFLRASVLSFVEEPFSSTAERHSAHLGNLT
jgi:hypothetical protein